MKDDSVIYFKVGLFVFLSLLIIAIIYLWHKKALFAGESYKLTIRFDNVAGLEAGDPVTVNGVKKGYVEKIYLLNNEPIVEVRIEKDVELKQDYEIGAFMLDLMGGKKIEIYPGKSETKIEVDKILSGKFYADISTMMAFVGNMASDISKIILDLKNTLEYIAPILNDKGLASELKMTIKNANQLTHKFNLVLDRNQAKLDSITSNVYSLTRDSRKWFEDNQKDLSEAINNLNELTIKSEQLISKIDILIEDIKSGKNAFGKLMYDETLLNETRELLNQTNALIKLLFEQAQKKGIKVDAKIF